MGLEIIADATTLSIFIFFFAYIWYKLGKNILTYVVLLFTIGVIILAVSDIISLTYAYLSYIECIGGKLTAMGSLVAILGLLTLVIIFPRREKLSTILPPIYFISAILIVYLFFTPYFLYCDPVFAAIRGPLWLIYALWAYILLILASFIPLYRLITSKIKVERIADLYMSVGSLTVIVYLGIAQILPLYYPNFEVFSAVHVLPIAGLLFTIAILRYGIYIVVPIKEKKENVEKIPRINYGEVNGIINIHSAYLIFRNEISKHAGIVLTIRPPQMLKKRYQIEKTPIVWLTYFPGKFERAMVPDRLHFEAVYSIINFLDSGGEVVMVDGIEYLVENYGRRFLVEFIEEIKAVRDDCTIILAVDSKKYIEGLADIIIEMESQVPDPRVVVIRNSSQLKDDNLIVITSKKENMIKEALGNKVKVINIFKDIDLDRLLFEGIKRIEDSTKKSVYLECMDYILSTGKKKDVMNFIKDVIDIVIPRGGAVYIKYTPRIEEMPQIAQFIEGFEG